MAPKKIKKPKPSADQLAAAKQQWAELETQLDQEMLIMGPSRLQVGRILYHMKCWLKQWGMTKGCKGRWKPICDKYVIDRKSAENWIWKWQQYAGIPEDEWVVHRTNEKLQRDTEKPQQDSENNTVKVTGLARPSITPAKDEDHDNSTEKRLAIECIFVLTMAEKHKFMDAVKALGEPGATQEMYKAVIAAAPKVSGVGA